MSSHENPDSKTRSNLEPEEEVRRRALETIVTYIGQVRSYNNSEQYRASGQPIPPQKHNLTKLPVNQSMDSQEKEDAVGQNGIIYYGLLHSPQLKEANIIPELERIVEGTFPTSRGTMYMTSIPLGEEAALVRLTYFDEDGELQEYRAQLWIPAISAEEFLFDHLPKD